MTNQEVINFLNQVRKILLDDKSWLESTIQPINEAFDMAISSLQAQDVPDTNVGDMVSRQKAIDALCKRCDLVNDDTCGEKCIDIKILEKLPSAQPDIIHCRECKNCQIDSVFHDYWCDDRKVWKDHYCGYAERRTE